MYILQCNKYFSMGATKEYNNYKKSKLSKSDAKDSICKWVGLQAVFGV